jgi:acyl carrier protein
MHGKALSAVQGILENENATSGGKPMSEDMRSVFCELLAETLMEETMEGIEITHTFSEDLGVSEIDWVMYLMAVEDRFGIEFPPGYRAITLGELMQDTQTLMAGGSVEVSTPAEPSQEEASKPKRSVYEIISELATNSTYQGMPLKKQPWGTIPISSGKLVAVDPLATLITEPFQMVVEKGAYEVHGTYVQFPNGRKRYVLAEIIIEPGEPANWIPALVPGEKSDDIPCTPVEAGMFAYGDVEAIQAFANYVRSFEKRTGVNVYDGLMKGLLREHMAQEGIPLGEIDWLRYEIPGTDCTLILFQSGAGDGCYPSFWGQSEEGRLLRLSTYFN